jgi:anti-sigma regulatory factor (Ser/Thr protein kinase)
LSELGARFDAYAERNYASADDLAALRMQFEGNGQQAETMRLKLAAVAEQLRWESEDLRKALTAVAERAERARKAG